MITSMSLSFKISFIDADIPLSVTIISMKHGCLHVVRLFCSSMGNLYLWAHWRSIYFFHGKILIWKCLLDIR